MNEKFKLFDYIMSHPTKDVDKNINTKEYHCGGGCRNGHCDMEARCDNIYGSETMAYLKRTEMDEFKIEFPEYFI